MKFRYLPFLAVGLIAVGCGSKTAGDSASNDSKTSSTTSSTTGDASTGTTGTTGSSTSSTGTSGTAATPGTTPAPSKPDGSATPGKPGAPATAPGGQPPKLTPEQQKAMQANMAQFQAKMKENTDKAQKATKQSLPGVSGSYKGYIDESKISDQIKSQPDYQAKLADAKKRAEAVVLAVSADGSFTLSGSGPDKASGFFTKDDGKPAAVIITPPGHQGAPPRTLLPVVVSDGGKSITVGPLSFKKA